MIRSLISTAAFLFAGVICSTSSLAQITGNVQLDAQYYFEDSTIGAPDVPQKLLSNGFANFEYNKGNFSAGLRYESYLDPILGYDVRYQGSGIPYRYLKYNSGEIEVTAGSFYEQFGSGMVLRAYEERGLGYDNAFDGFRVKYNPYKGVYLKGLIGRQRTFFNLGEGLVRGGDVEWNLNESCDSLAGAKTQWIIGGNFVSKYQKDQDPLYNLPENVGAGSGRLNVISGPWNIFTEFAYKVNDPGNSNGYIFKEGHSLLLQTTYTVDGFGATFSVKRIDDMVFRSDRNAVGNNLFINYLPATTKNHTYLLAALYPYATQPTGEFGFQGEIFKQFRSGTSLGGEFGTDFNVNYSRAQSIEKVPTQDVNEGYTSEFLKLGNEVYYEDFNVEVQKKLSKKTKLNFLYMYQNYNKSVIEGTGGGHIFAHTVVADIRYRLTNKKSVRAEFQHLYTEQDRKSWAAMLAEYSIAPHWFIGAIDQYNYGNDDSTRRIHYYTATMGYTRKANRITIGYGKQRAGILCVGGVCRTVPASNGFSMSITSSF
ncbi:MAG: hypothetical protein DWQ44_02765 [Bacteroidetes bacterium]|nr:MAG: hypothetical protein DWQ33_06495 [Bacteroidota bacterium]REK04890.1 MAG: hypothetical protein DWQ39_06660 [Bacteroidota bacterium]REK36362.1 MAG: hypothetical protein DWQ44_02765 [Bacteroidota bacterium]REK50972.1 MAG: hypothetical protein DWQ48_02455 [Bacteroidota bacterium]